MVPADRGREAGAYGRDTRIVEPGLLHDRAIHESTCSRHAEKFKTLKSPSKEDNILYQAGDIGASRRCASSQDGSGGNEYELSG